MKYLNDVSYKDCDGKVCKSLNSGDFKVLKYNDSRNVIIQFLKTGFETVARLDNIKSGSIVTTDEILVCILCFSF